MIKIASFNVENLYARPKAFSETDLSVAQPILKAYADVNALMKKDTYTAADKKKLIDLLVVLDIYYVNDQNAVRRRDTQSPKWAWLRKNRGDFDKQPADASQDVEIIAAGRADWIGWVELAKESVNEMGTRTTARVITDVDADILAVVEAEDRPSMVRFNSEMLGGHYAHVMLVDGNDERGIDVAIMTKPGFTIERIRSHVDLTDAQGIVFSRDCPQYEVRTPGGTTLQVLVNHFKSQSGGGGAKRLRQATAVRTIADQLIAQGEHVVMLGDLNEGPRTGKPHADNLAPLYTNASPLVECWSHANFNDGGRPGSFDSCGLSNRLDYIFLSQSLANLMTAGAPFRTGLWGDRKTRPTNWPTYTDGTMEEKAHQASDHSWVWVEVNVA